MDWIKIKEWDWLIDLIIKFGGVAGALILFGIKINRENAYERRYSKHKEDLQTLNMFEMEVFERYLYPEAPTPEEIKSGANLDYKTSMIEIYGTRLLQFTFNEANIQNVYTKLILFRVMKLIEVKNELYFDTLYKDFDRQRNLFIIMANKYYQNELKFVEATKKH